jgi:VCBS repeat-containing protein
MANDAGNNPQNTSDADMTGDHAEFDAVQLAQADAPQQPPVIPAVPGGTTRVDIPQGQNVVRVAVAAGQTVILPAPFDDQGVLAAKLGDGNLAIKVGDVTVILEGYQTTENVTVRDEQGDTIDIATVLASTDPNLEIETAAGPAAGAQGADNTGAFFAQAGLGAGLGGLNAVGVLDPTALQYGLIDNSLLRLRDDELEEPDNPVTITDLTPSASGGDTSVDEDGLLAARGLGESAGSDGSGPVKGIGDFTISAPDGVQNLTIDGQAVITNGVFAATSFTTAMGNKLEVTAYDPATGKVEYTYTLIDNENHPAGSGENNLFEDLTVILTDKDGDLASDTLSVKIIDDVPTAKDDSVSIGNANSYISKAGDDVELNDIYGADGPAAGGGVVGVVAGAGGAASNSGIGASIQGQHGKLTLNADGSYTYTRDNGAPLQADDKFTYTIKDGDGDVTTAVLTIKIDDNPVIVVPPPPPGPGDNPIDLNKSGTAVFESGLPDGSKSADNTETTAGSVKVTAKDEVATVTVDGKNIALDGTPTVMRGLQGRSHRQGRRQELRRHRDRHRR